MKRISILLLLTLVSVRAQEKSFIKNDSVKYTLNQITVSATRYTEPLLEIPYAVSIIPVAELKNSRGYGFDNVFNSIPGVLAQTRAGNQDIRLLIRGFGARGAGDRSNYGTSRGIRVMVDGIPETEPDGRTSFDMIDPASAEYIEVIRSNASATWGNASGGIINLSTIPFTDKTFSNVRGMAGSFGLNQLFIKAGTSLQNGKIFSSFSNTNFSGWRNHSESYRTLLNIGLVSNLNAVTKLGVFASAVANMFHVPGPLSKKEFEENPQQANSYYLQRDERRFNRLGKLGLTLDSYVDKNNSVSVMMFVNPKYLQRSERGTFRDFTRYHLGGNFIFKNVTDISETRTNTFVAGTDEAYQDGAILFYSLSSANQRGSELKNNKREGANNFGIFLQDEIVFNNRLSLIGGIRYDKIVYYSEDYLDPSFGLQEAAFSKVTPKAGITFRITPALSIYANLGGGVEVPAGNETDPAGTYGDDKIFLINPLLKPIVSTTYEIGTKQIHYFGTDEFIKSISFDLALYHIQIHNDIIPYRGGRFYFTAGETSRNGLELSTEINLLGSFLFKGALTLSNNKYNNYVVDSVHYGNPGKFADYSNNKSAGIPSYFYSCSLKYQPSSSIGFYSLFNVSAVGNYFADDANTIDVPSWLICNFSTGIEDAINLDGIFSLSGFISINNLFDLKYVSSAYINPDIVNGEPLYLEPGLPRNFVFSVSLNF